MHKTHTYTVDNIPSLSFPQRGGDCGVALELQILYPLSLSVFQHALFFLCGAACCQDLPIAAFSIQVLLGTVSLAQP